MVCCKEKTCRNFAAINIRRTRQTPHDDNEVLQTVDKQGKKSNFGKKRFVEFIKNMFLVTFPNVTSLISYHL